MVLFVKFSYKEMKMADKSCGPFFGTHKIDLTGFDGDFVITPATHSDYGVRVTVTGYPREAVRSVRVDEVGLTLFIAGSGATPANKGGTSVSGGITNTGAMNIGSANKSRWRRFRNKAETGNASVAGGGDGKIRQIKAGKPSSAKPRIHR